MEQLRFHPDGVAVDMDAIRKRIQGSDIERSLETQHVRCIADRVLLYELVLEAQSRVQRGDAEEARLRDALSEARYAATVLAHAYRNDTRPPSTVIGLVERWGKAAGAEHG